MLRFFTIISSIFLLVITSTSLIAQDVDKLIKKGKKELNNKQDVAAYNYFLDALYLEPNNQEAKLYAGICHLHLQSPQKALEYLLSVKDADVAVQMLEYPVLLAMAYHLNNDFTLAQEILNTIEDSIFSDMVNVSLVKSYIENAKKISSSPSPFTVQNMGEEINTRQHEYGTAAFSDHQTILYTSRPDLWDQDTIQNKKKLYENIFLVTLDSNFNWEEPHYFSNPHLKGHDAIVQIFDDNQKLITYYNGDLFVSEKVDNYWEKGTAINGISTPANESHGFITDNGNTIYFSSNFDSQDGNLDLYVSKKDEEGDWSEPIPLIGLNTPYDEDSPFISDEGVFYFSSKGHNSMGSFDIFSSEFDSKTQQWSEPVNLGYPINSVFDDLYYTTYGRMAYFSSLRPGGNGGMDLYRVLPFNEVIVSGKLTDENSGETLKNTTKSLQFGENVYEASTDENGNYSLKLPITNSAYYHVEGETAEEQVIVFHFGDSTQPQKLIEVPLKVYSQVTPKAQFDTHPDEDIPEALKEKVIKQKEASVVEIKAENDTLDIIKEKENIQEENITQVVNEDNVVTEKSINSDFIAKEEEQQPIVEDNNLEQENKFESNPTISMIKNGESANLFLYFDTNAALLNEVFYEGLDQIAEYLNTKEDFFVEVGGHTDNVGSEAFNLQLSERRAKAVALYLIEQGIEKSRVLAKGYGESE
ncbi:MAG: OmpA family protein, partial [Bacteroidota bacterium]